MKDRPNYNNEPSSDPRMFEVLIRIMEYGDVSSVARFLGWAQQKVDLIKCGRRRGPFEHAAMFTEQLRSNGNENADAPFLELARRLGYTATQQTAAASQGRPFSAIMKEAYEAAAAYEAMTDGDHQPGEEAAYARQLFELSEAALCEARRRQANANAAASNVRHIGGQR